MNRISKKVVAMITACIIALGICLPVFAAEPAVAAEPVILTNAKFVKPTGEELGMGMGTGVLDASQSTIEENGTIKVKLKNCHILWYTGSISEAYYADANGNAINNENLVTNDGYLQIDKNKAETVIGETKGIHLVLHFDMNPSDPPKMPNPAVAYFTCDNIQAAQNN